MALREISATSARLNISTAEAGIEIKKQRQRRPSPDPRTQRLRRAHARAEAALLEVEAALEEFHRGDDADDLNPEVVGNSPDSMREKDDMGPSRTKSSAQRKTEAHPSSPTSPATPDFSEKLSEHTVANLNLGKSDGLIPRSKTPSPALAGESAVGKENLPQDNRSGGSRTSDPPTPQLTCPLSTVKMRRYSTSTASSVSAESPAVRCPLSTVKMRRFSTSTASSVSAESPAIQWTSPVKTPLIRRDFGGDRFRNAENIEPEETRS